MGPAPFLPPQPKNVHATSPGCPFAVPRLDGSLSLPEIYNWHYHNNRDHRAFTYVDHCRNVMGLTYADVVPAAHRAGWRVMRTCDISVDTNRPVVAIIAATTDTITYATVLIGMLLAAIPVFPISPKNSPAAVAHLVREAGVSTVFVSDDQPSRDLTNKALELLTDGKPRVHTMPSFRQLYTEDKTFECLPARVRDFNDLTMIVHSSGSTSFPKLIRWNHKTLLHLGLMPHFGQHDLCRKVMACHALVMFHGLGVALIAWLPSTGLVMAVCNPELPPPKLAPDSIFSELTASSSKPDYVLAVPSFLQAWSEDDKKVSYFSGMKGGLIYGGGPLTKSVGDHLVEHGVPVYTAYGASEVGAVSTFLPECQGMDWEYFSISKQYTAEFAPDGTGTFEFVVVRKPNQELLMTNCTYGGLPAYRTNDILAPHPSKPGFWKVVGRADDQIMLLTGEKTNPGPLEAILNEHPYVAASVMFGRGRMQNGVLVLLNELHLYRLVDNSRVIEYRNSLWPTVEKMNSFAPTHSKIFKEMIIFAWAEKPFTFTAKGTLKRHQILADYEDEINDLYRLVEENGHQDVDVPTSWSTESSIDFVRTVVHRVLRPGIRDDQNMFELGCDSLNATWIRNSILRGLRSFSKRISRDMELTFVYQYPTIALLSQFIMRITQSSAEDFCVTADSVNQMQNLVSRFGTNFPVHTASESIPPTKDVVLVTGTTGSLACAALVHLVECDSVETIYALNRPSSSGKPLRQRQKEALEERGYSSSVIDCPKVVLLEGDTSKPGLALEDAVFKQICSSITHINHIAWPVDFNLTLTSFEGAIIGLRNLVDLALSSPHQVPPQFVFASSIGVLNNWQSGPVVHEEFIADAAVAVGQGYAESKWISERILGVASERTALRPVVVRIGQLSGTPSGAWNASDWFPLLLKSSITLTALPDLRGVCNWLPVDVAAKVLCDFRGADHCTLHLVHPRPVQMQSVMQTLSTELHLPVMPFSEWMVRLEKSASGGQAASDVQLQDIPALKILPFLREIRSKLDRYREDIQEGKRDSMGFPILEMDKALRSSPTLGGMETSITDASVLSWVQYWRRIGFLRQ